MDTNIVRQLRVETRGKNVALADSNDVLIARGPATRHGTEHLDVRDRRVAARQDLLDDGGPDEDARKGPRGHCHLTAAAVVKVREERQIQAGLEAVHLAAEMVPVGADVQTAHQLLAALLGACGFVGEQDEACTGAPCRF